MIIQSIYLSPTPLQSPEATPLTALLSTIINTRIKVLRRNAPASVTLQCYIATVRPPGPCAKWQGARILCYTIPYVYLFLFATDRCLHVGYLYQTRKGDARTVLLSRHSTVSQLDNARQVLSSYSCCHDMTDSCGVGIMTRKKSRACTRQARFFG